MLSIFPDMENYPASTIFSTTAILIIIGTYLLLGPRRYKFSPKAPKQVIEGYPILGSFRFFSARWDFFQHSRAQNPSGNFSFFLGRHPIVGLSGDKGRQLFFESRQLGFHEGYAVLFGQSPTYVQNKVEINQEFSGSGGYFTRRITRLLKADKVLKTLPQLISDVKNQLEILSQDPTGITDPFQSVYRIVYQLTMRMVGCDDIAEDPKLLEKTLGLFEKVQQSATPTAIMFPWFPSLAVISRTIAGGQLFMILNKIVVNRKKTGKRREDTLQFLIDEGDSMSKIIEFVIGSLFAGLVNSGVNACWVLVYLANDPYWLTKAREEVEAVAAKHSTDKNAPLIDRLSQLPVEAWETEFPIMYMCLRESIRLQLIGTLFRKNISGKDIPTGNGDEVIPPDAFVIYAVGDIHLDPAVYKDPQKFDPSRYLPDRAEDQKKPMSFLGWGQGRHPCLGAKFAKMEQNVVMAFFLAMFDFELTDKSGNPVHETPPLDWNAHSVMRPDPTAYLKYTRRA